MKLQVWLIHKVNDLHKEGKGWQHHPIWKRSYCKIPLKVGCGTVEAFKQYFDKLLKGKVLDCGWINLRLGSFNSKTKEITLWQV